VGDPGDGKSLTALKMAAIVTNGAEWPDVKNPAIDDRGTVILFTAEDDLSTTVRVRAETLGADLKKLIIFPNLVGKNKEEFFCIQGHLPLLEKTIQEIGDVKLVIFDSIMDYMGSIKSGDPVQVRSVLAPLLNLGEKHNVAIIGISHMRKEQAKAVYRVLGSIAFLAIARTVWLIHRDEDDPSRRRRFFSPLKANVCRDPTTLAFSIDGPIGKPNLIFEKEPVDITSEELLMDEEGKERYSAKREAKEWLIQALEDGPMPANKILNLAEENGIAERTLKRAKSILGVKSYKKDEGWFWELEK